MAVKRSTAVKHDTEIARIYHLISQQSAVISRERGVLTPPEGKSRHWWTEPSEERAEEAHARIESAEQEIADLRVEVKPHEAAYRKHRWSRYYIVQNGNGHVHSSTSCNTCFDTTRFGWLIELSGAHGDEAIEEWGERMCTVCFPDAPVHPRFTQPCKQDIAERETKAAEKAAKAAAKDAARVTLPNGEGYKSERAALNGLSEVLQSMLIYGIDHPSAAKWIANADQLLRGIAAKRGESFTDTLDGAFKRASKKVVADTRRAERRFGAMRREQGAPEVDPTEHNEVVYARLIGKA